MVVQLARKSNMLISANSRRVICRKLQTLQKIGWLAYSTSAFIRVCVQLKDAVHSNTQGGGNSLHPYLARSSVDCYYKIELASEPSFLAPTARSTPFRTTPSF